MKTSRYKSPYILAVVFLGMVTEPAVSAQGPGSNEKIRTETQAIDAAKRACSGQIVSAASMPGWKATYKDALWKVSSVGEWWAFHVSISAITGFPLERCRFIIS